MQISYNQLTEMTGFTYRTLKKRLDGLEPVGTGQNNANLWDSREALPLLYGTADVDGLNPSEEKARLDRARRIAQELKNKEAEGELLPAADVEEILLRLVHAAKTKMLGVKSKISPLMTDLIPDAATRHKILNTVDDGIRAALTELSQVDPADFERAK